MGTRRLLLDARNALEVPARLSGDTVIVGAGTVGLLLAISLARANRPVLMIEAGGHVATMDNNSETAKSLGKRHGGVLLGRAAGLGGTSVLWGGQLAEFDKEDLGSRKGAKWPLSYKELHHWYDHVYDLLGLKDRRTADEYRRIFGREEPGHLGIERFFTHWLPHPNFATLFRHVLRSSPLIRVILNATVNAIDFVNERADAVWATAGGDRRICITGTNFVFAAGTIANSRFFLTSQRLSAVPWKSNPLIGRYFLDNLSGKVSDVEIKNQPRFRAFFENGFVNKIKLNPKLRFAPNRRAEMLSGACGFFVFNSVVGEHIANIKALIRALKAGTGFSKLRTLPKDVLMLNRAFAPLIIRYIRDRRILAFFDQGIEFHVQAEQVPFQDSHIRLLDDVPGQDGLFRVGVDWQVDGSEIGTVRRFVAESDIYLQALGLARLQTGSFLEQGDMAVLERLSDTGHQCGGLRMAARPSAGVTDPNGQVWGTINVYVAGASVFPTTSHANCTLTALALTARLAERLAQCPARTG